MKLIQVYANQPFKTVKFSEDFNVILGKVTRPKDSSVDSHNLGKTTLIHIINFLLLKGFDKNNFLHQYKNKFEKYTFFLEILLNDGRFLTIRRSVEENTKISMILHTNEYEDYRENLQWTYNNIAFLKAKEVLNELLNFDVVKQYSYRKTVSYFLRTQDDYLDVFQLNKFKSSKDIEWKPVLFDLLGFNGEILKEKYELDQRKTNINKEITLLQNKTTNAEEIDKIKGLIEVREEERNSLKLQLDQFNFYKQELNINLKLVEEIEFEISKKNSLRYSLEFELEKIQQSLQNKISFDLAETEEIFNDVKIYFPKELKKDYQDLIKFNEELFTERKQHLVERLKEVKKDYKEVDSELVELNNKQSKLLAILQDKDTFKKFKKYQTDIIKIESEILLLQEELKKVNEIGSLTERVERLNVKADGLKEQIKKQVIEEVNNNYSSIRKIFNQIIKDIINLPAIPSIKINKNGNVEYEADIQDVNEDLTAKGKGTTYRKLLCVAFDLAILINYSNKSFFKFVYHDGALEGLDNRKKIKFINLAKRICKEYNLQYILTSIEDDLPRDDTGKVMEFPSNEIAVILDDKGDSGRLFEQSF